MGELVCVSDIAVEPVIKQIERELPGIAVRLHIQRRRIVAILQFLVLTALLAVPTITAVRIHAVADPDIWWHLSTGNWIVQHHAVPFSDPFSSFAGGKPWAAYSWIFELLVLGLFQKLGLAGILVYTTAMVLAIAWSIHRLVRSLQPDFIVAVLITAAACFCLPRLWTPRSWLFSILFFVLELHILMRARRTGKLADLFWLPVLFALWSNLHIQFADGLIVLTIAVIESSCARFGLRTHSRLSWKSSCLTLVICMLALCANPYGWRIFDIAYVTGSQPGILNKIQELQAVPFRSISDWGVLVFCLAATAALARARRADLFEVGLFAFAIFAGFRTQRDIWVLVIVAAMILASRVPGRAQNRLVLSRFGMAGTVMAAVAVTGLYALGTHVNAASLNAVVDDQLPAGAVNVVKARGLQGPLYNDFTWGGYLFWALQLPVTIDGRTALYGDEHIDRSVATWTAKKDWASDADLQKAHLVIAPVNAPLTQVLRLSPHFHAVFEDKVAAVFVATDATSPRLSANQPRE